MNYTVRNLLIASALMLVGILAVTSYIRGERQSLSRGKQEITVYVAAKDIPPGTPKKDLESGGYLDTIDVLREDAPPNAIGKLSDIAKSDVVNETVYQGEMLSLNAFDKTAGLNPTAQIKGNERLFTVPILAANDVAGMIRPGDSIDITATLGGGGGSDIKKNVVLARDIEVIETPESLRPDGVEATDDAPDAEGATKLYVLKATDKEARNIQFGLSMSDEHQLFMWLRPSNGDTDSNLRPMIGPSLPKEIPAPNFKGGAGTDEYGPDIAVN